MVVTPFMRTAGMAMYPFIFFKRAHYCEDACMVNHGKIHHRQQIELLIIPFYLFYLINYLINLLIYKHHHDAYCNICFEREAYKNEENLNYMKERKFWNWLLYIHQRNP